MRPRPSIDGGGGLRREELPSAKEWGKALRALAEERARALHRFNGLGKVLRAILRYMAARGCVVDRRAVGAIAKAAGLHDRREVRRSIARLDHRGELVRLARRGVRLDGQRGHETNAIVIPATLLLLERLRPARAAFARAKLALLALRVDLAERGVWLPWEPAARAIGPPLAAARPPPAVLASQGRAVGGGVSGPAETSDAAPPARRGAENRGTSPPMGFCSSSPDRSRTPAVPRSVDRSPSPRRARGCGQPAGAGRPERAAAPNGATHRQAGAAAPAPPYAGERHGGPRATSAAPAAPPGPGAAGSRRDGSRAVLPDDMRTWRVPSGEIVRWREEHQDLPRHVARRRVDRFDALHAFHYWREKELERIHEDAGHGGDALTCAELACAEFRGEHYGRRPRWRGAARELAALRWHAILTAWRDAAGPLSRRSVLDVVRFSRRRRALRALAPDPKHDRGGPLTLELEAPPAAARELERHRDHLEELAAGVFEGRVVRLQVEVRT